MGVKDVSILRILRIAKSISELAINLKSFSVVIQLPNIFQEALNRQQSPNIFRCGIVSLWMAGQHLDPDSEIEVQDIQDQALDLHFTKHGEMFSATNMAKLAEKVYHCEAQRIKGSWEVLTKLPKTLDLICVQEKLILVPYDSDADQWPALRKGQKAHWGVIFGVALMMPFKTKIFDDAKHLDSFVSYLKPPLSSSQVDMILEQLKEIRYLLMVRQSKSKRIFLFNSR